jgi:hypothetical protein
MMADKCEMHKPDQWWFWTKEWQEGERRVDEEIRNGDYEEFDNEDDLIMFLERIA